MSYAARQITLTFNLSQGNFAEGGNTVTLSGLRVDLQQHQVAFPGLGQLTARVFGMTLADMNSLTTAGLQYATNRNNTLSVTAGDAESGMTKIFSGIILEAYPDFTAAPDVPLVVSAQGIPGAINLAPTAPTSFSGGISADTLFERLASQAGLSYAGNSGVKGTLVNPYLWGTATQQITQAAQAFNAYAYVDGAAGALAVWPKGGSRSGGTTPIIAPPPQGEMIGYPIFQTLNVFVRTLFNPNVLMGGQIQVKSSLQAATGTFLVTQLDHLLSSIDYNDGPWETDITCTPQNAPG